MASQVLLSHIQNPLFWLGVITSSQFWIAIFGVTAVAFSQAERVSLNKWAGIMGLVGQPFWFRAAYTGEQWGIFFLCFLYTFFWAKGVHKFWFKKTPVLT